MRESKPSPERSSSCSPRSSVMAFSRRGETLTAPADPEFVLELINIFTRRDFVG